jgi:uncharacterized protein (TIGR03067 family)
MRLMITLAACLLVAADGGVRETNTDTRLANTPVGVWEVTSTRWGGKDTRVLNGTTFAFRGGRLAMKMERSDSEEVSTCTFQASRTPALIDWVRQDGSLAGVQEQGLYAMRGGELLLCLPLFQAERPTDLSGKLPGYYLLTLKRVGPSRP